MYDSTDKTIPVDTQDLEGLSLLLNDFFTDLLEEWLNEEQLLTYCYQESLIAIGQETVKCKEQQG